MTLLWVAVIVVAALYGLRIGNDNSGHGTTSKWCVAVTCNIDAHDTEGPSAVRLQRPRDRPQEY